MPSAASPSICPRVLRSDSSDSVGGPTLPPSANWTPLHESVFQLDLSATQLLLQQGADPNAACVGGITPAMLLCLLHCYSQETGPAAKLSLPEVLHEHLEAWREDLLDEPDDSTTKPLLQLLLSHGARVDLLYPGGYDMLEAASVGYASGLMEVLLGVEPFRSMMEGSWSSSSSGSSQPHAGQPADASVGNTAHTSGSGGGAGGAGASHSSSSHHEPSSASSSSAVVCSTAVLDRCSRPLFWSAKDDEHRGLAILQLGWRPEVHPADAGTALLTSCNSGHYPEALALVKAGADVNYQQDQETSLGNLAHWIGSAGRSKHRYPEQQLELARLLVAKGAHTADGATPVQVAVTAGWVPLLQACVEANGTHISSHVLVQTVESSSGLRDPEDSSSSSSNSSSSSSQPGGSGGTPNGGSEVGCTLLELAISHNHFTMAAMLVALGGRFTPGCVLEQLQQQECTGGPDNVSEAVPALLLAGLLRHGAQQEGQQAAVEAYDLLISLVQGRHGPGAKQEPGSNPSQDSGGMGQSSAAAAAASTSTSSTEATGTSTAAAATAAAAAGAEAPGREHSREDAKALPGTARSSRSSTQATTTAARTDAAAADSHQAAAELSSSVFTAVCELVERPAHLEELLKMLVAVGLQDPDERPVYDGWLWNGGKGYLRAFSAAMRHLQQQHTLEAGSLAAVQLGLWSVARATVSFGVCRMHSLHSWACGRSGGPLPLPLFRLLGVTMDLPCFFDELDCLPSFKELQTAIGNPAPPLALALAQPQKWTKEVQKQRLGVVKALVAAGASYNWEGPAGATVLSLAVENVQTDCLEALLARPNALQEFTPEQVSAALVTAAKKSHYVSGCLVLEAVAAARSQAVGQPSASTGRQASSPASTPGAKRASIPASGDASAEGSKVSLPTVPASVFEAEELDKMVAAAHDAAAGHAADGGADAAAAAAASPTTGSDSKATPAAMSASAAAPAPSGASGLEARSSSAAGPAAAAATPGATQVAAAGAKDTSSSALTPAAAALEAAPGAAPKPTAAAAAQSAPLVLTPAAVAAASKLLVASVKKRSVDTLSRLLAAGANPNVRPDSNSDMAIHEVVSQADAKGSNLDLIREMLEELLEAGADINATTTGLGTPVMQALWQKKLPVAQLLLEYKPDLQPVDKYNRPAIYYAASWFGLEGVKLLLQEGCPLPEGGVPRLVEMLRYHPPLAKVSVGAVTARLKMVLKQCQPAGGSTGTTAAAATAGVAGGTSSSGPSVRSPSKQQSQPGGDRHMPEDEGKADKAAAAAAALLAEEEAAAAAAAAKAAKRAAKKQRQSGSKAAAAAAAGSDTSQQQQQQDGVGIEVRSAGLAGTSQGQGSTTSQVAETPAGGHVGTEQEGKKLDSMQQQEQEQQQQEAQRPAEPPPAPGVAAGPDLGSIAGTTAGGSTTRGDGSSTHLQVAGPSTPTAAVAAAEASSPPWQTAASKRHSSVSGSSGSSKHAAQAVAHKARGGRTTPEGGMQQASRAGRKQQQQQRQLGLKQAGSSTAPAPLHLPATQQGPPLQHRPQQEQQQQEQQQQKQQEQGASLITQVPSGLLPALGPDAAGVQGRPLHTSTTEDAVSNVVSQTVQGNVPNGAQSASASTTRQVTAAGPAAVADHCAQLEQVAGGTRPFPGRASLAAAAVAAGPAGSPAMVAAAGGEEFVNPLPWLPTLWVPVRRTQPAATPAAVVLAAGTGTTSTALRDGQVGVQSQVASSGSAGSLSATAAGMTVGNVAGSSGPVATLPWLTAGQVQQQQQQQQPHVPNLPWLVQVPQAQAPAGAEGAAGHMQVNNAGVPPVESTAEMYTKPSAGAPLQVGGGGVSSSSSVSSSAAPTRDAQDAWASLLLAPGITTSGAATRPSSRLSEGAAAVQPATSSNTAAAAAAGAPPAPPAVAAAANFWSRSTLIPRKQGAEWECVVCWEAPPAVQLLPCKHTVLCRRCSDALCKQEGQECPMCRTPVQKRVNLRG